MCNARFGRHVVIMSEDQQLQKSIEAIGSLRTCSVRHASQKVAGASPADLRRAAACSSSNHGPPSTPQPEEHVSRA